METGDEATERKRRGRGRAATNGAARCKRDEGAWELLTSSGPSATTARQCDMVLLRALMPTTLGDFGSGNAAHVGGKVFIIDAADQICRNRRICVEGARTAQPTRVLPMLALLIKPLQ